MIQAVTLAAAWAVVLICGLSALAGRRRLLFSAVLFCSLTLTIQSDAIYPVIDDALGGLNRASLVYRTSGLICFACFDLMIARALSNSRRSDYGKLLFGLTAVMLGAQAAVFFSQSWPVTQAHLIPYAGSPMQIVYQSFLWAGLGAVAVHAGIAAYIDSRGRPWDALRWGVTLIGLGAIPALLWCVRSVVSVALGAMGNTSSLHDERDDVGKILVLATVVLLSTGIVMSALPRVIDALTPLILLSRTRGLWRRACLVAPEVSLSLPARLPRFKTADSTLAIVYRRWVEIQDAVRLGKLVLSERDRGVLSQVARVMDADPGDGITKNLLGSANYSVTRISGGPVDG